MHEPQKVDQEIADVYQIFEDLQFFAKGLGTGFKAFPTKVGFYMPITEIPWKTNEELTGHLTTVKETTMQKEITSEA